MRLGLSLATVKFHIRNIRSKLELGDREAMVAWEREPEAVAQPVGRRWLLAPLGTLLGFWKPVVGTAAVVVVGGAAVAGGVLAYTIANDGDGEAPAPASASTATATASPAPTATPSPTPTTAPPTATPPPATTPAPDATPTPDETATPSASQDESGVTVTFWGEVPEEQQAELRERVRDIVRFYDKVFGVRVPDLSIHIASDEQAFAAAVERELDYETRWVPALYEEGSIFVHAESTANWIERFYFEAFEVLVAEGRDLGPEWLAEGAAVYMGHLFREWRGDAGIAGERSHWELLASSDPTPLEDLERRSPTAAQQSGLWTLSTVTLAVDWLVAQTRPDALVEYYRALPDSESWQDAFETTFGFPVEDAYEGIAVRRGAVRATHISVVGVIRQPGGARLSYASLFVDAFYLDGAGSVGTSVNTDGTFRFNAQNRALRLEVSFTCPGAWRSLGWYEEGGGLTFEGDEAAILGGDGEDIRGVVIELPASHAELREECPSEPTES